MPAFPPRIHIPREGGSDSIRSTLSLGYSASFGSGTIVSIDRNDGRIRPFSSSHPNDPIIGMVEKAHPPMNTEIDVVMSGLINIEWIERGKTYFLTKDGLLTDHGGIPVLHGLRDGQGLFVRPQQEAIAPIPTGTLMQFCGISPPEGWMLCNGSLIEQSLFPRLHAVLIESAKTMTLKSVSFSKEFAIFAYEGTISAGTKIFMSTLGWRGIVHVMSCGNGLLTVTVNSNQEFPLMSQAIASPCEFSPVDAAHAFLPNIESSDFRWIIKI